MNLWSPRIRSRCRSLRRITGARWRFAEAPREDTDKAAAADITPVEDTPGIVYFEEARLVLECRKLYYQDLDPEKFLDESIHQMYPKRLSPLVCR